MSVVLLANVGLRDVLSEGKPIDPARTEGERLMGEFEASWRDLSTPMLSAVVDHLLKRHGKIQVVLYGTDQPEGTPPLNRDRDTIHAAHLAGRLLERQHGKGRIEKAVVRPIRSNPSRYDDMISFFSSELPASVQPSHWMAKVETCYVFPVGGTPACNMGLMVAALDRFGVACHTLYLQEGESRVTSMDVGEQMRRGTARKLAANRLSDQSFGAAVPLLREARAPEWVTDLALYARHRYHFDFEVAVEALDRAIEGCAADWSIRSRLRQLHQSLGPLRDRDAAAMMRELYHNAAMTYRRGEYAAFLGLVFRIQEEGLARIVEEVCPWLPGVREGTVGAERFAAALRSRAELWTYLQRQKVAGRDLILNEPNTEVLAALVRSSWDGPQPEPSPERRQRFQVAYDILYGKLGALKQLRNKCIIAHGFEGVSENSLRDRYGEADPIQDMATALEGVGIEIGEDPFGAAARLALEGLEIQ